MKKLRLAKGLEMDASEAATQTFAPLAAKGGGKSYLAGKMVELLVGAGCPVTVIEPVGNWWPIRLAADGKSPGLEMAVVGGLHGDVAVEPAQGEELGRFLVETNGSAVVDVSGFSKRKRKEFVADFCEAFFAASRLAMTPRMLVLEEAQLFAPQHAARGEERMLGAVTDIVRLGRNFGIGSMLVSQRPQSVSKEVLNQVECLFVGGMRGPHERKAIAGWVTEQADGEGDIKAQLAKLPSLPPGDFFCWSPSWLKVAKPIRVLPKTTFDGTSTPKLGGPRAQAPKLSPVDVEALAAALAPPEPEPKSPKSSDAPLADALDWEAVAKSHAMQIAELELDLETSREVERELRAGLAQIHSALDRLLESTRGLGTTVPVIPTQAEADRMLGTGALKMPEPRPAVVIERAANGKSAATGDYQTDLLRALAAYGPSNRLRLSLVSGKSKSSSTFAAALRALKSSGLVEESAGELRATREGKREAGSPKLPRGRELFDHWCSRLGDYDERNFRAIALRKNRRMNRNTLAGATGHSKSSSSFAASLRRLKALGLVVESGGEFDASPEAREMMGL